MASDRETWSPSLQAARSRANLGLPLSGNTRFRFLKRIVYRISWLFLNHQIAYNEHMASALEEVLEAVAKRQDELVKLLSEKLELGLLQANREIGDHISRFQSEMAKLQLDLAQIRVELSQLADKPAHDASGC